MPAESGKGRVPDYGGKAGYRIFHGLLKLAGPVPAYLLLALILPYYLIARGSARRSAYPYLCRRFPGQGSVRRFFAAGRHMFEFGKVLIDQAAMGIAGRGSFSVEFEERDRFYELAKRPAGMVLLTTHMGNWQTAMATMDHVEKRINLLLNLKNQEGRHFFDLSGERDRFNFIPPDGFLGGMVEATAALKAGEIVAIMGDRAWGAKTREAEFLGEKAMFPVMPYHLACATGADVVVLLTVRTGRLAFTIEAICISEGVDLACLSRDEAVGTLLKRYVSCLEDYLERNPYMWFNFFDFWKKDDNGTKARGGSKIVS